MRNWIFQNIANIITLAGVVGAVWLFIVAINDPDQLWLILLLFIAVGLTDLIDGWISRRLKITSILGAALDRLRDKILICPTLIIVVWSYKDSLDNLPMLVTTLTESLAVVLLIVEILLTISWFMGIIKKLDVKSNKFGKRKMFAEFSILLLWLGSLSAEKYLGIYAFSRLVYIIDLSLLVTTYWAIKSLQLYCEKYFSLNNGKQKATGQKAPN
jgi:CDP-diacylglycerol--glycerol-3-phosphate 3-phosphatidyltransferase